MTLTTKTARRLEELKSKNTGHDYNWEIKEIINFKNELKEIIYNPSLDDLNTLAKIVELTKEIESVENGNM